MTVTLDMPEPLAQQLQARWGAEALSRRILEAFAVEGYRQEFLTRHQVGELLGLSLWETEAFLKAHDALL
ncbi:MAG: UPF0175 family protein, partial [Armatimonadetes bacterium]|nr:UPF0175 family protein [Armatimonadota bacterium]